MEYVYIGIVIIIIAIIIVKRNGILHKLNEVSFKKFSYSNIGGLNARPWIVEKLDETGIDSYIQSKNVKLTPKLRDGLGGLLKLTPEVIEIIAKDSKMLFKFGDDIKRGIDAGIYKQMMVKGSTNQYLGLAKNQKGRIVGHGKLTKQEIKKINPAKLANAALGVMSIITSQEYLDRINQQLMNIDRKVDLIYRNLKNDKYGITKGNLEYLKSISAGIYDISDAQAIIYQSEIQTIVRTSLQQIEGILQEFPPLKSEMENIDVKSWVKLDKFESMIMDVIKNFDDFITLGIGNLEVLAISIKINNELPGISENFDIKIFEKTKYYLTRFQEIENEFIGITHQKVSELNASWRSFEKNFERYMKLETFLDHLKEKIKSNYKDVQNINDDSGGVLSRSFDLQIECDSEGNILKVNQLIKEDAS